jgi:uncharacterized membrane protein
MRNRGTQISGALGRLAVFFQPERLFLALALPFGILFIFLSAPFQAPDEHAHFYRAFAMSMGQFAGLEVSIPESVLDFSKTVSKDLPGNDQNRQSKKALVQEFSRKYAGQPLEKVMILNSALVSPLPYLPQSAGVLIGRLLSLNPIFIFYLGRLANFFTWAALTWLAIRITPIHPRLFVALALMPMTLHQAASNSPDTATIGLSFVFVAYALRMLMDQQTKIAWDNWLTIALLTMALALCKSIYVLSAGLLLLIPLRRFRSQRISLPLSLAVIALGVITGLVWLQISSQWVTVEMMNASRTPTTAGILYILQHPQEAAPVLWRSAVQSTGLQMRMFIGILGWMDTRLPGWVYPLYYAILFFVVIFETHHPVYLSISERLWTALLAILSSFVLMAIFFYPGVSTGNGVVETAQGRYYIPFGLFYFLPFSQRKWRFPDDSPAWGVVALLHGIILLAAARAMLWRYYSI